MSDPTKPAAVPGVQRIFTATLLIGPSGQGKTSLAATFAEYLWETFQRVLLLYSCDGGAFPTMIQKRIRQGLIRAWRMRTRSAEGLAFETCYLASKGYWPRQIKPETGETDPAVLLVPPVTARYQLACPAGHDLKTVPSASLIVPTFCSTCKQMVPVAHIHVVEDVHQTKGFEQVGGVFYDGLTSMCGWFMGALDLSRGHGTIGGEKPPLGGPVLSGSVKFGGNNRADYGFAQTRAYQIVHNALSIPNLCEGPVFTALPDDVTEGGGQLPIVGPKLAGSAMTADALQWFGNALEARIEKSPKDEDIRRLYLTEFIDVQNRRHLLKNSGPGTLPAFIEDPPINKTAPDARQFFSGFNLGNFFRLLDRALADELAANDLPSAPGIAAAPTEYGEATGVTLPSSPAPSPAAPTPATPTAPAAAQPAATASAAASPAPPPAARPRPRPRATAAPAAPSTPAAPATPAPAATAPIVPPPSQAVAPAPPARQAAAPAPAPSVVPPPPGMRPPAKAPGSR